MPACVGAAINSQANANQLQAMQPNNNNLPIRRQRYRDNGPRGSWGEHSVVPPLFQHPQQTHQQQQPLMEIGQVPINLPVGPDHMFTAYSSNPHILICSEHPTAPHIPPCQVHGIYQQPFAQPCGLGAHFAAGFAAAAAAQNAQQTISVPSTHQAHYQHPQLPHMPQHVSNNIKVHNNDFTFYICFCFFFQGLVPRHDGLLIDQFDLQNTAQSLHASQLQAAQLHSQQQLSQIQPPQHIFIAAEVRFSLFWQNLFGGTNQKIFFFFFFPLEPSQSY